MTWFIGWVWWWVLPIRKRMAVANYAAAFPDRDPGELRQTVGELAMGYIDLLRRRPVHLEGMDLVQAGGICLAGHGGAWDLGLCAAAKEVPTTIFVKPPANRLAAWWITRVRRQSQMELLPPKGSALKALRALKRGRLLVFVQDQRENSGIQVDFFGRPARTSRGLGTLLVHTGAPVFGAWQWRDERGHHLKVERIDFEYEADPKRAIPAITQATQDWYEQKIRERPHSWLWLHNRWRN
jgi:KDO2-lipid IV(A) lauroyltransferase